MLLVLKLIIKQKTINIDNNNDNNVDNNNDNFI